MNTFNIEINQIRTLSFDLQVKNTEDVTKIVDDLIDNLDLDCIYLEKLKKNKIEVVMTKANKL